MEIRNGLFLFARGSAALSEVLQAFEPGAISQRNGKSREREIDYSAVQTWHSIRIPHRHLRSLRNECDVPTLCAPHAVRIFKLPFEEFSPFTRGDCNAEHHLATLQVARDPQFLPRGEFRRAENVKARVHFPSIPKRHALRDEESEDLVWRFRNVHREFQVRH